MITPKNWSEFQHYKDRNPPWIKLHHNLLDNYEFSCLPVASRALAPLLWLLASEYEDGVVPLSDEALAYRLRMSAKEMRTALYPLIEHGFFTSDSTPLASCEQRATPETEGETETQVKAEKPVSLEFEKFKRAYPKRTGAQGWPEAERFFHIAVKAGHQPDDLIAAAAKFSASLPPDTAGTKFVPMAEKWMRTKSWKEFIPTAEDKLRAQQTEEFLASRGFGRPTQ